MNKGDYVRTKDGIAKIEYIDDETGGIDCDNTVQVLNDEPFSILSDKEEIKRYVIKSSPNIIDLIEVGDYVNGSKVIDIAQAPKKALYTEDINQRCALIPITNNRIKNVLTKEQFSAMEYKVESEVK